MRFTKNKGNKKLQLDTWGYLGMVLVQCGRAIGCLVMAQPESLRSLDPVAEAGGMYLHGITNWESRMTVTKPIR